MRRFFACHFSGRGCTLWLGSFGVSVDWVAILLLGASAWALASALKA